MNNGLQDRSLGDGWAVVVDAGGGTLDWYVAKGRQPNWNRSGAHPKSMLACANAVADRINPVWRDDFTIIERIDKAIRTKAESFQAGARTYEMAPYSKDIEDVLRESTTKLISTVGSLDSVDRIIFTGGGAIVYYDYFRQQFPEYSAAMVIDTDPVYSNVRGFQLAGEMLLAALR